MTKQTRRGFLRKASIGAATAGVLTAVSSLATACSPEDTMAHQAPTTTLAELSAAGVNGPIVAYMHEVTSGEVRVLVGTREYVYHDPEFIARVLKAVR